MTRPMATLLLCGCLIPSLATAAEPPATQRVDGQPDPTAEITTLREELTDAFNKRDVDRMLSYLTEDVIVVWQNAEVSYGRDAVRKYYNRMMADPNHTVESASFSPTVDHRQLIPGGNAAVSYGKLGDSFHLNDGSDFRLDSVWSAAVVKQADGKWRVASFHASPNAFDNGVLRYAARKVGLKAGLGGGIGGLVLGLLLGLVIGRRRRGPMAAAAPQRP